MSAFLDDYGNICVNIAKEHAKSLIIRYWMTTLAAAYSEEIISMDEMQTKAHDLCKTRPIPDCVIYLKCNFNNRIERIDNRNSCSDDDRSIEQDKKYEEASEKLSKLFKNWYIIDNTGKTPQEEFNEILQLLPQIMA
jgi:thymidylate kinase